MNVSSPRASGDHDSVRKSRASSSPSSADRSTYSSSAGDSITSITFAPSGINSSNPSRPLLTAASSTVLPPPVSSAASIASCGSVSAASSIGDFSSAVNANFSISASISSGSSVFWASAPATAGSSTSTTGCSSAVSASLVSMGAALSSGLASCSSIISSHEIMSPSCGCADATGSPVSIFSAPELNSISTSGHDIRGFSISFSPNEGSEGAASLEGISTVACFLPTTSMASMSSGDTSSIFLYTSFFFSVLPFSP